MNLIERKLKKIPVNCVDTMENQTHVLTCPSSEVLTKGHFLLAFYLPDTYVLTSLFY
jgi:hypothetical protein